MTLDVSDCQWDIGVKGQGQITLISIYVSKRHFILNLLMECVYTWFTGCLGYVDDNESFG